MNSQMELLQVQCPLVWSRVKGPYGPVPLKVQEVLALHGQETKTARLQDLLPLLIQQGPSIERQFQAQLEQSMAKCSLQSPNTSEKPSEKPSDDAKPSERPFERPSERPFERPPTPIEPVWFSGPLTKKYVPTDEDLEQFRMSILQEQERLQAVFDFSRPDGAREDSAIRAEQDTDYAMEQLKQALEKNQDDFCQHVPQGLDDIGLHSELMRCYWTFQDETK